MTSMRTFCPEKSAHMQTYSYMGAFLDSFGSDGDSKAIKYSILRKISDTKDFFLKQDLQMQICCIWELFFSEMDNF